MRVAIFTAQPIYYYVVRLFVCVCAHLVLFVCVCAHFVLFVCVCAHFVLNLLLFVEVSVILP